MTHEETLERANEDAALREARIEDGRFASPIEAHDPPGVDEWTEEEVETARVAVACVRERLHFAATPWEYEDERRTIYRIYNHDVRDAEDGGIGMWGGNTATEVWGKARADNFGHDWPAKGAPCSECGRPKP